MLTIYGRTNSSNVQKLLWLCDELDLTFELQERGGPHGGLDTADYRALNPNGLVPTIVDEGGLVLWESNAILRHLAASRGAAALYPGAPAERAIVDQWLDWSLSTLTPSLGPVFLQLVRVAPEQRDAALIAEGVRRSTTAFTILDGLLAEQDFLAGSAFTIADIPVGIFTWRWFELPLERPDLPALEAWYLRMQARPAYRRRVMVPLT